MATQHPKSILAGRQICKTPEIDPNKVNLPDNLWNIHRLIQTIICGETSNGDEAETREQWIARLEDYACELERQIYT